MTFPCDSCHSRLTISRALASFRLCSSDPEQYSGRTAPAVWLQSEQRKTKVLEQARGRKSARRGELRWAAGQHQHARLFFGRSRCAVLAGTSASFGDFARYRPRPLITPSHPSPSRAGRVAQDCHGKATRRAPCSSCPYMVPTCTGPLLCVQISGAQAAAELRKQSRVAACGAVRPQGGMERLYHIRKRALSIIARAQTHSPLALMAGPSQGTFRTVHSMHARSLYNINALSQGCVPPRAGPDLKTRPHVPTRLALNIHHL